MIKLIVPLLPGFSLNAVFFLINEYRIRLSPLFLIHQKMLDLYVSEVLEERTDPTPFHPPPPSMDPQVFTPIFH